jgi:hypothetical protein
VTQGTVRERRQRRNPSGFRAAARAKRGDAKEIRLFAPWGGAVRTPHLPDHLGSTPSPLTIDQAMTSKASGPLSHPRAPHVAKAIDQAMNAPASTAVGTEADS